MSKSKSDISNSAIRIFLQDVGKFYDKARGFETFIPRKGQKQEMLKFFNNSCCYCGESIDIENLSQDHLIPMNKTTLGLHAWGNVVPCCKECNNEKQQKAWNDFLISKCSDKSLFQERENRIQSFIKEYKYDPNLDLHRYADNLYEDIGEVAMTLINLRYKQAEEGINKLLEKR